MAELAMACAKVALDQVQCIAMRVSPMRHWMPIMVATVPQAGAVHHAWKTTEPHIMAYVIPCALVGAMVHLPLTATRA